MTESGLSALRDIHLPPPIGFWPMGYGWYLLIIGLLLFAVLAYQQIRNRRKAYKIKLIALTDLEKIEAEYHRNKNVSYTATQLTRLVKRFCLHYYSREQVAPLYGTQWKVFLGEPDWIDTLFNLSYQDSSIIELSGIFSKIKNWIKQFKGEADV